MSLYDADMSYLSYSAYILNLLYIALFELNINEIIRCLLIINPGFTDSKPLGGFMGLGQSKEYQELLGTQWLIVNSG